MKLKTKIAAVILNSAFLILNLSSCYAWWEQKIPMDSDTPQVNLSDFLYEEKPITSLEAPVQVIASQGIYKDSIKLRWEEVSNAKSYRIERAVKMPDSAGNYSAPEEGDFQLLEKYVYNTTYEDKILSSAGDSNEEYNYKYYYRICAENIGKGYESSPYTDISNPDTAAKGWLLAPPKNLSADKGKNDDSIEIRWDPLSGATAKEYIIYRGQNPNGLSMEEIATVRGNQTSFKNEIAETEQGIEFYYKVCAKLNSGETSAFSGLALGYSLKYGSPSVPSGVLISDSQGNSTSSISVKWDNTSVTPNPGQTLTWSVYRTSSADSSYTLIKTNLPAETNSIVDSDALKPGIFYNYYIQAVIEQDGEKIKSPFSQTGPGEDENAVAFILSCPSDVEITDSSEAGMVNIRWTPAIGSEEPYNIPYTYNIYSDTDQNGTFAIPLETNFTTDLGSDGWYQATVKKQPFYKISTVNASAVESDKSYTVAPVPEAPASVEATKTKWFDELNNLNCNTNEVYPVKITWKKPETDNPYGYNIYRSTKTDSSFRKLNEQPVTAADSNGNFVYIDENETARAGTYYYYKVVSINVLGQGKKSNDPANDTANKCRGYGAITREQWFREYNKTIQHSQTKLTLMHKSGNTDKLGQETVYGDISGSLFYNAKISGLSGDVQMTYKDYADFSIADNQEFGPYFVINGNTNTKAGMDTNGNMYGTVSCTGMYPGGADYSKLVIKGGAAGGGTYEVKTFDLDGNEIFKEASISWLVGEE